MNNAANNSESEVRLIESDQEFFSKSGPLPLHWNDVRQFPRFYCRSRTAAVIFPLRCQPQSTPQACQVLMSDISRGGMSLVMAQQVFPGQQVDVSLSSGEIRRVQVAWCRRRGDRCYSVGTQFVS